MMISRIPSGCRPHENKIWGNARKKYLWPSRWHLAVICTSANLSRALVTVIVPFAGDRQTMAALLEIFSDTGGHRCRNVAARAARWGEPRRAATADGYTIISGHMGTPPQSRSIPTCLQA
jgi:hypothetical protein